MKRWTLQLANNRELVVEAPTIEDAAMAVGIEYPGVHIVGWSGEPIPGEAPEGEGEGVTETTDETEREHESN